MSQVLFLRFFKSVDKSVDSRRADISADNLIAINEDISVDLPFLALVVGYLVGVAHYLLALVL